MNTAGGVTACAVAYDPFGSPEGPFASPGNRTCLNTSGNAAASVGNASWYRGGRRDGTTGDYQLGTRTYTPGNAAFSTPDSHRVADAKTDLGVGTDPLTANTYIYVNGNPLNAFDPDGHVPCDKLPPGDRAGCEVSPAAKDFCSSDAGKNAERCGADQSPGVRPNPKDCAAKDLKCINDTTTARDLQDSWVKEGRYDNARIESRRGITATITSNEKLLRDIQRAGPPTSCGWLCSIIAFAVTVTKSLVTCDSGGDCAIALVPGGKFGKGLKSAIKAIKAIRGATKIEKTLLKIANVMQGLQAKITSLRKSLPVVRKGKRSENAADAGAASANSSIRVVEESGGVIEYEPSTSAGKLSIMADVSKADDVLTLNNFDIDGPGRNSLGAAGLRGFAGQLGRQEGVSQVVIRGAPRTSGPNPGSVSRAITIKVDP